MTTRASRVASLQTHVEGIRHQCLNAIEHYFTANTKPLRHCRSYADGFYELEVHPDGSIVLGGYALEMGAPGHIDELSLVDLSYLVEEAVSQLSK